MSMKKFNKATLAMAVAGALVASTANAVNIAEDGIGDYIFSPFYTVRNGFETYINVTNTSDETVIFKIRFREHLNSRDVRDFNVVLSPYDVWTAAVTMNDDGDAARIVTHDNSCTVPISIRDNGIDFTNAAYIGDGGPTSLERTTQGYFEIINMGQENWVNDGLLGVHYNSKHVNGEPVNCNVIDDQFKPAGNTGQFLTFDEPENSLKVNVAIINVNDGLGFAVPVTTLANFYNGLVPPYVDQTHLAQNIVFPPSDTQPNASAASPKISQVHSNETGVNVVSNWTFPADAVTAVLMRASVINQFRVEDGQADTDWVFTLPTKNFYVDLNVPGDPTDMGIAPFPDAYGVVTSDMDPLKAGSCFNIAYEFWDREEASQYVDEEVKPSPDVPVPLALCRETNVLEFGSGVLGGHAAYNLSNLPGLTIPAAGWMRMTYGPADTVHDGDYDMTSNEGHVYEGLPTIGFAIQNLDNWSVDNDLVQYGFAWDHSYGRSIWVNGVQYGNNPTSFKARDLGTPLSSGI